ncbi:MAG: tetratricopeptide repeat protein, partial [Pseudomonas marincola]
AKADGAKIKYVFLTHFHADFVSGQVDLAKKTGATIVFGPNANPIYDIHQGKDGEEFKIGRDAFGVYNPDLKNEFNLLQAEAALEDYDIELATTALEGIRTSLEEGTNPEVAARREYLEGIAALRSGDINRAIAKFDQAIALDVRPIAVRARYEKINAELAQKIITPEEAVEAFQKTTFAWRGDDLELNILKRIGDLHIANGKIREGMQVFRNIVMTFPKVKLARDIAREMSDMFDQLFLEGAAEKLPPIKALALYYEYRELTPLGKKGDKMIRNLADRLIKVDLLEQAAQLLDHQVNFRLKGELKALTGTKLAVIHLWNDEPKQSLSILYKTRWRALPDKVKKERLYIQARANADLSNFDEALSLIEDDKSKIADQLRADIYWKSKKWPKAINALEKLMRQSGADKAKKLSPVDRQRLMQIAVARSLANDQDGIATMRQKFRKKLVDTPDLDAFDLITDNSDGSETNFRERSTAIAKISQLESFMTGYREQLKNGEFWSTN